MKKILMALCAVALFSLTACHDDPINDNPTGGDNNNGNGTEQPEQPEQIPEGEGIYNPGQRIVAISYDGVPGEEWNWQDNKLTSISKADENGNMQESSTFEYNGWRLASMMSSLQGAPFDAYYSYTGDKLSGITAFSGNVEALDIAVTHNGANKINHMDLAVNNTLLNWLFQMFGGGFMKISPSQSKLTVDNTDFDIDLTWQGDNVSQMLLSGSVNGTVTLGELRQMFNLDSILGNYAAFLAAMSDSTILPLQMVVNDTMSFTYDSQHNPYYGFLGELNPSIFSANNTVSTISTGAVSVTLSFTVPYIGSIPFTIPYTLPSQSIHYTYTYNTKGYPVTVTDDEGSVTQYTYQQ